MDKIRVGITGQSGFIGTHLFNTLGLYPDRYERVPFEDSWFEAEHKLRVFAGNCDVVVHLAAMNRHGDPRVIYDTNITLIKRLISACEVTGSRPHIIFSSSTQEAHDNLYGRSKREGRILFEQWAERSGASFTGVVIPNVFGPFGHPYYNSVIATFCYQLTHGETPKIDIDGEIGLIYVGEVVNEITELMTNRQSQVCLHALQAKKHIKVSDLLERITRYRSLYLGNGMIPCLDDPFERDLFNTFVCYIDHREFFPFRLTLNADERGSFTEIMRMNSGGQLSFSTTRPGVTRGNHFHTRKAERFAIIKGRARISFRRIGTDEVISFELDGSRPAFVDMPVWYTHNITNTGDDDLYTVFWISEHFDQNDPDTYYEKV